MDQTVKQQTFSRHPNHEIIISRRKVLRTYTEMQQMIIIQQKIAYVKNTAYAAYLFLCSVILIPNIRSCSVICRYSDFASSAGTPSQHPANSFLFLCPHHRRGDCTGFSPVFLLLSIICGEDPVSGNDLLSDHCFCNFYYMPARKVLSIVLAIYFLQKGGSPKRASRII